jgi:flavin reductase (DIM6/NTAB) family NADH-FMN oxidoreductase RutF
MPSSHDAPPEALTTPLELDPVDWEPQQVYFLLTGLVIPRPIAWVSTIDAAGVPNVAPHSYFNVVSHDPPHVMFSSTGVKDTLRNLRATGEFVVNIVTMDVVEEMNATATDVPPGVDEFAWVGLDTAPSRTVTPPRVASAKAHFECRVVHDLAVGNGNLVVGEVTHLHVDPSVWSGGRVDPALLDPVCRLAGTRYATLGEVFTLPRPSWADVAEVSPPERVPRRAVPDGRR